MGDYPRAVARHALTKMAMDAEPADGRLCLEFFDDVMWTIAYSIGHVKLLDKVSRAWAWHLAPLCYSKQQALSLLMHSCMHMQPMVRTTHKLRRGCLHGWSSVQ